jgi:hypothetical protein
MSIQSVSRRALPALLLTLLAPLGAVPARATSYVMVSDEALVDASPLAVVGRIVSVDKAAVQHGGAAVATEYRVAVEEQLKGQAPAKTLSVRVPGGLARNGLGLKIYGAPQFRKGERALLFLEADRQGGYRLVHFLLGAFHEVPAGARSLAVRNLNEASEMRVTAAGLEEVRPSGRDTLRDFAAFAQWVKERAHGVAARTAYQVEDRDGSLRQVTGKYTLFADPGDGKNMRWFVFDTGGNVPWKALSTGQTGLTGGGYSEFQAALQAWNNEPETPIDYRYTGTTASINGLDSYDQLNTIVFNDPSDILPDFSCAAGGVLALGGPWYEAATTNFQGKPYHSIPNADIVINNGIGCFFSSSPDAVKAAQELFGHELGHTLGLGHSCGDASGPDPSCSNPTFSDALMRAYVHDDSRGARLNSDDQAGVRSLYKQGAGNNAPAAPSNLTAAGTSANEIHLTWHDNSSNETEFRIEIKVLGGSFADIGSVPANTTEADVSGLTPASGYAFRVRARNTFGDSAYSNEAEAATTGSTQPCVDDATTLCLSNDRFRVQVTWKSVGSQGIANVVTTSDVSGLLWFFDPSNYEVIVKVLNGCATDHPGYWVFIAGATDVQYTVTVTDTKTGAVKVYFNQLGSSVVRTEIGAFATCP